MAGRLEHDEANSLLTDLAVRYRKLVRSVISQVGGPILRESGEDVEQHVWVAIWRRLQGEQEIDHPTSYIYTVARREAIRAVQEELGRLKRLDETPERVARPADDPHRRAVSRETGARIRSALLRLSSDRRRAIQAVLSGLDVYEIMDLCGWSYDRARNLIARGRADLRAFLQEEQ